MKRTWQFVALAAALICAGGARSDVDETELDCWKVKDQRGEDYRVAANAFKGVYVGRLTVLSDIEEIHWAKPAKSRDGPDGYLFEKLGGQFRILKDRDAVELGREHWIKAVDVNNMRLIVINRRSGEMLSTEVSWASVDQAPYDYHLDGLEARCEVRRDLF